jgi:hypothetical protein
MSFRILKKKVFNLLTSEDFAETLSRFSELPAKKVINPLFSFLYHTEDVVRWHAVSAMGVVTAELAEKDMESARIIMRRLIWNLNDESGGIGWGSPESMGDICARSPKLSREFAKILVSYSLPDGNFLEHEVLQRGLLWGLYRLSASDPQITQDATPHVREFLYSKDPYHLGLAASYAGCVKDAKAISLIEQLTGNQTIISHYKNLRVRPVTVSDLAHAALGAIR